MIRVKDKDASIKFYEDVMGMKLKRTSESPNCNHSHVHSLDLLS